jgi:hypothetical protein
MLAALVATGLAGCSDSPTGPVGHGNSTADLSVNADMELQVAGDDVLAEVAVEDMVLSMDSPHDGTGTPFAEARLCFSEARQLVRQGDQEAAKDQATECRRVLVETLIEQRGEEAIDELFGLVESLVERLSEADDEFERLADLEVAVQALLEEAYGRRDSGDLIGAGERLLLALQITDRMRHRHRDFIRNPMNHARLAIARAIEAVRLGSEIIEDPTLKQERVMFQATELLHRARFAFDHAAYRRAVVLARRAEARMLFAVLECERPTVQDAVQLLELAERVIQAAEEAIGVDPPPIQQVLLQSAIRLKEAGAQAINNWHWRGVGLLWHAAVTAAILLPSPDA